MLAFILLTLVFSPLSLLTRTVLPFIIAISSVYGVLLIHRNEDFKTFKKVLPLWLLLPAAVLLLVMIISAFFHAAIPHGMVDPLITYAVQPDRWLDAGGMYFLSETKFSFFPLIGEMLAVWPASLASGRLDQLCILQLFQMTLLMGSFLLITRALKLGKGGILTALLICFSTPILIKWAAWAKTDMTALFLYTAALSLILRRWIIEHRDHVPYLAWFLLGLSLATKWTAVTAVFAVTPLIVLSGYSRGKRLSYYAAGIALLTAVPLVFALRNYLITGEPFYPMFSIPGFSVKAQWAFESVQKLVEIRRRTGAGIVENIVALFRSWGIPLAVFTAGSVYAMFHKDRKIKVLILMVALYTVACIIAFNPLEWGSKYAIILLPAMTGIGLYYLRNRNVILLSVLVPIVFLTSSIFQRSEFIYGFATNNEPLRFEGRDHPPTLQLHLWMNENLPEGSRVLSLWRPERYFSDHEIIVAQNHWEGIGLFTNNSVDEEYEILQRLGVDFIYFYNEDPLPGDLEETVNLLEVWDSDERFLPIGIIGGYLLCEIEDY